MKLLFISIFTLSIVSGKEYLNPNGRPFLLNVSVEQYFPVNHAWGDILNVTDPSVKINMPISTWMTVRGGFHSDLIVFSGFPFSDGWVSGRNYSRWVWTAGVDFHIPLYQLWEK